jgi:hypothetical protein
MRKLTRQAKENVQLGPFPCLNGSELSEEH